MLLYSVTKSINLWPNHSPTISWLVNDWDLLFGTIGQMHCFLTEELAKKVVDRCEKVPKYCMYKFSVVEVDADLTKKDLCGWVGHNMDAVTINGIDKSQCERCKFTIGYN